MSVTIDFRVFLREEDPQSTFEVIEEIGQGSFGSVYKVGSSLTPPLP